MVSVVVIIVIHVVKGVRGSKAGRWIKKDVAQAGGATGESY